MVLIASFILTFLTIVLLILDEYYSIKRGTFVYVKHLSKFYRVKKVLHTGMLELLGHSNIFHESMLVKRKPPGITIEFFSCWMGAVSILTYRSLGQNRNTFYYQKIVFNTKKLCNELITPNVYE